jgi:uncharacterized membrane protein
MFSIVGLLLAVYGLVTGGEIEVYKCSLGININLIWGCVLLVFGAGMLVLAKNAAGKTPEEKK